MLDMYSLTNLNNRRFKLKRKEVTMPDEMHDRLKDEKIKSGETMNTIIRTFINEGLKKRDKERSK